MINLSYKPEVHSFVKQLGACSKSEVVACTGLPPETVEACLHSLAVDELIKAQAMRMGGKKGFAFVWWKPAEKKGSYRAIRKEHQELYPGAFEMAKTHKSSRKGRVLILDRVRKHLEDMYPTEYSVDDMREALGVTYGKVLKAMKALEREGVVTVRKEVYGRGRPRMMYTAANGKEPKHGDEGAVTKVSFEDDEEAIEL